MSDAASSPRTSSPSNSLSPPIGYNPIASSSSEPSCAPGQSLRRDLPARPIPLDELRILMLKRQTSKQLKDAVWANLVCMAHQKPGPPTDNALRSSPARAAARSSPVRYRLVIVHTQPKARSTH